ncbi:hypothetical protein CTAYLR_000636 [Chrysophaeum taylorii]|uniref:Uncharacterized protein n=1 Tax=Chrysophaeum taylorii TaxID=2483200 RepID=A0AAD7U9G2_9STRA|nr:hypothetical protein CTAYLR_000636 [Chrysophaeum taylorii]
MGGGALERLLADEDDKERFDKDGVRWTLPVVEALDPAQVALISAVVAAGEGSIDQDDELSIVLHNANIDINMLYYGQSPLFIACNNGQQGVVDLLLRWPHPKPIAVDLRSDGGETPFLVACRGGHLGIVQALMGCGADPNVTAADGRSGLWCACHGGHVHVLQWLLDAHVPGVVDWTIEGPRGVSRRTTCVEVARVRGHLDAVPIVEEGIRRWQQKRAKDRLKKATVGARATVRIRDAEGVFFTPGNDDIIEEEIGRERHFLGDEEGIDFNNTRASKLPSIS